MNFDGLIGKKIIKVTGEETEVKNKVELKSWFEDDKLYVGKYVKHKINQLDEPEVTLDKAFEKVAESYSMTKEEVWRRIEWFETHREVLSQDWINKFTSPVDDDGRLYVWKSDLQNLLVPKQEEVDQAYKNGYEKGKQHTFYKGYLEGLTDKEKEPETVASVIDDFFKSAKRMKEVLDMEVDEPK